MADEGFRRTVSKNFCSQEFHHDIQMNEFLRWKLWTCRKRAGENKTIAATLGSNEIDHRGLKTSKQTTVSMTAWVQSWLTRMRLPGTNHITSQGSRLLLEFKEIVSIECLQECVCVCVHVIQMLYIFIAINPTIRIIYFQLPNNRSALLHDFIT